MSKPRASLLASFGIAAMLSPARARAADEENIVLEYSAPATCGDAAGFAARVRMRTTRAHFVDGAGDRKFAVTMAREVEQYRGELVVSGGSGASPPRSVVSTDCEDVSAALVLMVALAIDPKASLAALPPPAPATTAPTAPTAPSPLRPPEARPPPPAPAAPADRWMALIGSAAGMRSAVAPDLAFGPTAFVAIERVRRSVFRPMLRGAVAATAIQHVDYPRGTATFGWLGATMEACPLGVDLARNFRLRPCASFTFGALRASATPATDARNETRRWLGAGALGRFEWEVLPRTMRLELGGGLVVPFQRDRFFVAPDTTLFVVPSAGMTADVGVAFLIFS